MDENPRRQNDSDGNRRQASNTHDDVERDERLSRRSESSERPALTRREREERWPIG